MTKQRLIRAQCNILRQLSRLAGIIVVAILALLAGYTASAHPLEQPHADPPWNGDTPVTQAGEVAGGPPAAAATGSNVWAAWAENDHPYLARSTDSGGTWSIPTAVTTQTLGFNGHGPALAALSPNTIEIAWHSWVYYGQETIFFKRSTNGGQTWGAEVPVRSGFIDLKSMALAAGPGGRALLAWRSTTTVSVAGSADSGATWPAAADVHSGALDGKVAAAYAPSGTAHLVWAEASAYDAPTHILYARSTDNGATWSAPVDISQAAAYTQTNPTIAIDAATGDVHVAWTEQRPTGTAIYHTVSKNSGSIWSAPQSVSGAAGSAAAPALSTWTSGVVYAVWEDYRLGQADILFARSTNRGASWSSAGRVNEAGTTAHQAPAVATGDNVHPAWLDYRSGSAGIYTTHLISSCAVGLSGASISGAASVPPGDTLALTGGYTPSNASLPIVFTWSPAPQSGQGSTQANYSWAEPNIVTVTFSAANCGGAFSANKVVTIPCPAPVTAVSISGPAEVTAGSPAVFTAQVEPVSPYQPVTYAWTPEPQSGQGTAQATYLWQTPQTLAISARVWNCSGAWGKFEASQTVTVSDTLAPVWAGFSPSGWISTTLMSTIVNHVRDAQSGLDTGSATYEYSQDGGGNWSGWAGLPVSGSPGVTTTQVMTVSVLWNQDSGATHNNRIHFQIKDMAGNLSTSAVYRVNIDTTAPVNPTSLSGDRAAGTWSSSPAIQMTWSGGGDATSGVLYLVKWGTDPNLVLLPGWQEAVVDGESTNTSIPSDGSSWYFFVRAIDKAGNLASATIHAGPYWLDTTPPNQPVIYSSDPPTNTWTANRPVQLIFGGSSDAGGSGLAGYSFLWDHASNTTPDTTLDTHTGNSWTLADGRWYFHVRAADNAGNWTAAVHYGPVLLDSVPTAPTGLQAVPQANTWINAGKAKTSWLASSDDEGITGYAWRWDWGAPQTPDCQVMTSSQNWTGPEVSEGRWWFSVRGRNINGLCSPAANIGPFLVDRTAPKNPLYLDGWRASASTITAAWGNAFDALSGVYGYQFRWSQNSSDWPDAASPTQAVSTTSPTLADGNWYFSIRTRDVAGNWSSPAWAGPYLIDAWPPSNPDHFTANHPPGQWTTGPITVNWSGASDGNGSGVDGYSVMWSEAADTLPPAVVPTPETSSTKSLPSGQNHYIHVRTRDKFGNWSPTAAHYGPFWIDVRVPVCHLNLPKTVGTAKFTVSWYATDSLAPVSGYDIEWRDNTAGSGWQTYLQDTALTSQDVQGVDGHYYDFRCRARNSLGSVGEWSSYERVGVITVDLQADWLEVNQVVQDQGNHVALLTDKHTYVRLHVSSLNQAIVNEAVTARLQAWGSGSYLGWLAPLNDGHPIKANPDRGQVDDSFTFELPMEWTHTGMLWLVATVDPEGKIAESTRTNNTVELWPHLINTNPLCLVLIQVYPTLANPDPNTIYTINDPGFWDIIDTAKRYLPLGDPSLRLYTASGVSPLPGKVYDFTQPSTWDRLLEAVAVVDEHTSDPCDHTHYFAMIDPDAAPNAIYGGYGNIGGPHASGLMASDPITIPRGSPVPLGPVGGRILAHELGHNLGRWHVRCTQGEASPDLGYWYPGLQPNCAIGKTVGGSIPDQTSNYNAFRPLTSSLPLIVPPVGYGDLMSYDTVRGISDYTYNAILAQFAISGGTAGQQAEAASTGWSAAGDYLFVSGTITPTGGTASLDPFYRKAEAKASRLQQSYQQTLVAGAPYSLTMETGDGTILYSYPFSPTASMDGPLGPADTVDFALTFPFHPGTQLVRLYEQGAMIGSRAVSAHAPVVTVLAPAGGESVTTTLAVRWDGSDADSDPLTYLVRYSPDSGATWQVINAGTTATSLVISDTQSLPGSAHARVQVIASDGLNTSSADSAAFFLARHAPQIHIFTPKPGMHFLQGQPVTLEAAAMDAEDGWIESTAQITWTSATSGTLGSGPLLSLMALPVGPQHVTVTVQDSDGQTAMAEVIFVVESAVKKLYLPLAVKKQ